ncbi:hypothetical protein LR48_Vigan05g069400 [Vigna angularis]|uniref:Uncharacterized protein n=2 Tax=Phaseolus angularis TaxID=3914 RepID=A0A0L9UJN7_PHAAN|nr:hypothetical protein LR48_Vigan05g069400 [Vigna angularis]BAT92764.1 hypothetical protein VIGAN_07159800 [Vigna angularis var. angularis]
MIKLREEFLGLHLVKRKVGGWRHSCHDPKERGELLDVRGDSKRNWLHSIEGCTVQRGPYATYTCTSSKEKMEAPRSRPSPARLRRWRASRDKAWTCWNETSSRHQEERNFFGHPECRSSRFRGSSREAHGLVKNSRAHSI